jgi:Divergent InlB B-repeat domain
VSARSRFVVLVGAVVAAIGLAGGAPSALVPKVTLTVVVSGNGGVLSHPAGISCPTTCKLKIKRGAHVVLTAQPDEGSQIGSWSAGCGTKKTCTVTMTKSKTVSVSFKTPPPPPTTTATPPPPLVKGGHYDGTYTDGTFFKFDVSLSGGFILNIEFPINGDCSDGGTIVAGEGFAPGPYAIQTDGSFSASDTYTYSNGTVETTTVSGNFAAGGSASGRANVDVVFGPQSDSPGVHCTSNGTWTAKLSS